MSVVARYNIFTTVSDNTLNWVNTIYGVYVKQLQRVYVNLIYYNVDTLQLQQ